MKAPSVKPVRCAIYTRVSTEHGLDQEFNSLDAQHDAASAYIKSQAHAGWTLIKSRYDDLWARYRAWKGLDAEAERIVLQDYYDDGSGEAKRYYQVTAVNRTIEAIAKGANRVLLVMATGSGKTRTAFQIIWHLSKADPTTPILFLTTRNRLT